MRVCRGPFGLSRFAAAGLLSGLLVVLNACGSGQSTRNVTSILMGPAPQEEVEMIGRRPEPPGGPRCPSVTVRDGTEAMRVYERGREGDPRHLRFQGTLGELARECIFREDGQGVTIRYGIAGRLITGPAGGPGNYELPLRVAVMRVGGEAVWSRLYRVPVTVQQGEGNVRFQHVAEDIQLELPAGDAFGNYVIFAGFDEIS